MPTLSIEKGTRMNHTAEPPVYSPPPGLQLPRLARVRQRFDTRRIADIEAELAPQFARVAADAIGPGMRVAITAGSRGIADIDRITAAVVAEVRGLGAEPFVVSAMGSHGGATPEGQRAVLASYGITAERVGCPVVAEIDTVHLGDTADGIAVYVDRAAYEADAIVLLNRVKPHTILTGELGSGLMKIAGIGLGNPIGADSIHRLGLSRHLLPVARMVLERAPVRLGVAIVDNSLDQTWKIEVVPAADIEAADRRLLAEARALLPNIPFDPIDVLVIDTIGKNISGTGMDPNVIGMHRRIGGAPERTIERIVALDLSDASHGNANGVGMADIITERLRSRIDWHATYTNALTANFLTGIKLPLACPSGQAAVALAARAFEADTLRLVRIVDTAHLEYLWVSPALLAELDHYPMLEQAGDLEEMIFGDELSSE
jgi:hypothetical protein